jgi:spermidine synthase
MTYYVGIALISAATFLLQLALLRIFAVQQFYHFAFMAISLALLGFGASGSLLSVWGRRLSPLPLCLGFGITTVGAYLVINYLPFDSFSIAWDPKQPFYLALYFLAAAVPFLFSGLLVGGELMAAGERDRSHLVYGANLIGSALGSLGALLALEAFGGVGTVILAALLGVASGLLFLDARALRRPQGAMATLLSVGLTIAGGGVLLRPPELFTQQLSPYKTLSQLLLGLDSKHVLTEWDATARLDVVESSTIHSMPGLSLLSPVGPPPQAGIILDGDTLMPITGLSPDAEEGALLADHLPIGLAYRLRPEAETLVLSAGTGMDVLLALAAGAPRVTAVEEQGLVIETLRGPYRDFTGGLYLDERIEVVQQASRVYARALEPGLFDLVTVALTDPHRPVTSGAYSLTESYLYTVEAFRDYLRTLEEGGLLVVTRWLQTPPSEETRLFGTVAEALAGSGSDPKAHLAAFRSLRTMTVIASENPLSAEEVGTIRTFLQGRGFDAVYYPGIRASELNRYNVLPEPVYHDLFVRILERPEALYENYRFDIRPATDDRPFFFHFFKWRQTPEILASLGRTWQPFGGSGFFVLVALLVLVALAAVVFILGPLLLRSGLRRAQGSVRPSLPAWRVLLYFACLGLAFLFIEVSLSQHFILVLGQPVTALAVILLALLLFSGLGALTVRRWSLAWGLGMLVAVIALYPLLLPPFSALALRLPEGGRLLLTVLALAPLGYLMGLPFAAGLHVVERHNAVLVPWAWAINGSFSVISAVLAVIVALSAGFSAVLWLGAAAYVAALAAFWGWG